MTLNKQLIGKVSIPLLSLAALIGIYFLPPIPQDPAYHLFEDQRTIFNLPNFWNVLSNLPFLVVGILGLFSIYRYRDTDNSPSIQIITPLKTSYIMLFFGASLVAFGSGYYHIVPSNHSLVWDRIPMTIAFMALFSIIIAEYISVPLGKLLLWPLIAVGLLSVLYWRMTENNGNGDLRPYALVQFLPLIIIPLIMILFKPTFTQTKGYWWLMCGYMLAKGLEHFDKAVFDALSQISGHSLKHVAAAIGLFFLLKAYQTRTRITS